MFEICNIFLLLKKRGNDIVVEFHCWMTESIAIQSILQLIIKRSTVQLNTWKRRNFHEVIECIYSIRKGRDGQLSGFFAQSFEKI